MADQEDTDIHKPDGFIARGEKVGHGDKRSRIRKRDGLVFPGEEVGYVDEQGNIRRPDGIVFQGEAVGQVKGDAAHAQDGIILSGEQWGYVDGDGNVRQRDGVIFRGRIIGKMRGKNKAAALGYFVLRFDSIEKRFLELQTEVRSAPNKGAYLGKVRHMLDYVPKADALGDFDGLIGRLKSLEQEILDHRNRKEGENRSKKAALVGRAESLAGSTDWKATAAALQALQKDWKAIGFAGKECDDSLWSRFRAAQDRFYERRTAFFEQRDRERAQNRTKKEALCSQAESLRSSTDWKTTSEALKRLQEQWKQVGSAGREHDEALWQRFRSALDHFFERRSAFFSERDREHERNRSKKESLCARAESLSSSTDWKETGDALKRLQEQWKQVGPAGREHDDHLWNRFRSASDHFFERRAAFYTRQDAEKQDNLHRKERICSEAESLVHASNTKEAVARVKELQAAWKTIGHVPRENADSLWARFRAACDRVFEYARRERDRKQAEWQSRIHETLSRKREQASRLRESIDHDEGNVSRWQSTIYGLHEGRRADEIRSSLESKISDVEDKIRSKRDRLQELEQSIRELESKLR